MRDHYIFYENTSLVLTLLRNGSFWENDACDAQVVKLAIQPFTFHVHWEALGRRSGTPQGHLLGFLKGPGAVFAMDQEHQRTLSDMPRKWVAPLSSNVLTYGYSILRCFLTQGENLWTSRNEDREDEWYQKEPPEAFLQTAILHLRRNPVINIRIFVYSESPEHEVTGIEVYLRLLLTCLKRGMTNTRLPRSTKDYIHHHITLITSSNDSSY